MSIENTTYVAVEGWGDLPEGWTYTQVAGVAVDSQDRVYVFNRSDHPLIVLDCEGRYLASWGEGVFTTPHAICLGPDERLYLVDCGDHTIRAFTLEGELLHTWGRKGHPRDQEPFNKPTGLAFSPSGAFYVTDGYGNARVHKFSADGEKAKPVGLLNGS